MMSDLSLPWLIPSPNLYGNVSRVIGRDARTVLEEAVRMGYPSKGMRVTVEVREKSSGVFSRVMEIFPRDWVSWPIDPRTRLYYGDLVQMRPLEDPETLDGQIVSDTIIKVKPSEE